MPPVFEPEPVYEPESVAENSDATEGIDDAEAGAFPESDSESAEDADLTIDDLFKD